MKTRRLTVAQAVVEFMAQQHTERDGVERRFFPGVFGIFGHGNVAGVGQALQQAGNRLPYLFYRAVEVEVPTNVVPVANMVFIPPGTFAMGSPPDEPARTDWEGPQTQVTISRGFWMGKYEVTQAEYLEVLGSNPSYFRNGVPPY